MTLRFDDTQFQVGRWLIGMKFVSVFVIVLLSRHGALRVKTNKKDVSSSFVYYTIYWPWESRSSTVPCF
jgi:hypothetical protein